MAVKTTTYTDDSGLTKTGYYDDAKGETYTDANLTQRVPTGSIVDTAAGQYVLTDTGSQKYDDYMTKQLEGVTKADTTTTNDYINQLYDQSLKAQLDEIAAQQSEIGAYYDTVRNQAAATQAQSKNAFNEYAAASGLNAGTGGQAELARQNVYGNALNTANTAQSQALEDLAAQRSSIAADVNSQRNEALYNELVRQQKAQQAQQEAYTSAQTAQEQAAYTQLEDYAKSLAAIGDYSGYQALYGWTDEQVAQAESLFKQQNAAKTATQKSANTSKPTLTYSQMMTAIKNKQITPNVIKAYEYYMGEPYGTTKTTPSVTATASKTGMYSYLTSLPKDMILRTLGSEIDNGNLNPITAAVLANRLGAS